MPRIRHILIAPSPAEPMKPVQSVRAVPGRGLEGDRYYSGVGTFSPHPARPDFELTLIEQEQIDAFAAESGLAFGAMSARRNIVTEGMALNELAARNSIPTARDRRMEFHGRINLRCARGRVGRCDDEIRGGRGGATGRSDRCGF